MVNDSNQTVLAQNVEKRIRNGTNKLVSMVPAVFVVKEVAIIENFYEILLTIHNDIVAHSGENKTEYQIDLRYACFPTAVIDEYIKYGTCLQSKRKYKLFSPLSSRLKALNYGNEFKLI